MSRWLPIAMASGAAAMVLAASTPAAAQRLPDASWRRHTGAADARSSLYRFTLEARFGAYYPEIDEEFGGGATPYADYFGNGAQFYFGVELDWTPIVIPYIGRLGPGFGWGYTTMNAPTKITTTNAEGAEVDAETGGTTSITIHPMHASAVLRIDEISKRTVVPIVPYAKLGFGFGVWSSGTNTGTSKVGSDCAETKPTDCRVAEGLSFGPHVAFGGMLGLNWLDPRSGAMAREGAGITQAYLFGEWMWANLDSAAGGKSPMHIGTSTWVLGLALDL